MKKSLIIILSVAFVSCSNLSRYKVLDNHIDRSGCYEQSFVNGLDSLKRELETCGNQDKWDLSRKVFNGYMHYNLDSCFKYCAMMADLAGDDNQKKIISKAGLVKLLYRKNCQHDALVEWESIDTTGINGEAFFIYYSTGLKLYQHLSDYGMDPEHYKQHLEDFNTQLWNRDSTHIESISAMVDNLAGKGQQRKALQLLESCSLSSMSKAEKSRIQYMKGRMLMDIGEKEKSVPCLIESACLDIELTIKNNTSLYMLSEILYETGRLKRSSRYLKLTIDNNRFCNYKALILRNSKLDHLVSTTIESQNSTKVVLASCLVGLSFLFSVVLGLLLYRLRLSNMKIQQASKNKNVLISRYLESSADYIYGVDELKKTLRKTAKEQGVDAVMSLLRTAPYADSEFKNLKHIFDDLFMWMCPDFVERINRFMKEDCRFEKPESGLTTELRLLALIWLGITDRQKMSKILHLSSQSIYTYHSLIQKRSLYSGEQFDSMIERDGYL